MPALLTKMSRGPKASAVLATAARSSSAEPLSALRDSALSPADSISRTSSRAFSGELKYVKATDAPSAASRRTMPAPMPLEPPVTRATLPLNAFACIGHQTPLSHLLCPFWITLSRMRVQANSFPGCPIRSFFLLLWFSQRVHRQRKALDEPTSGLSASRKLSRLGRFLSMLLLLMRSSQDASALRFPHFTAAMGGLLRTSHPPPSARKVRTAARAASARVLSTSFRATRS